MVRVPIAKISDDPIIRELLMAFDANSDSHLETKEVDVDRDGKIDCNQITKKWMYPKLGPVENALFRAGLITELRNSICLPISDRKDAVEVMQRGYAITRPGGGRATHLQTFGAGPCYVLTLYDKGTKTGVMAHIDALTDFGASMNVIVAHLEKNGVDIGRMEARLIGGDTTSRNCLLKIKTVLTDFQIKLVEEDTIRPTPASVMLNTETGQLDDYQETIHTTDSSKLVGLGFIVQTPGNLIQSSHLNTLR